MQQTTHTLHRRFDLERLGTARPPFFGSRLFGKGVTGACDWSRAHTLTQMPELEMSKFDLAPHPLDSEGKKRRLEPTNEFRANAVNAKRKILDKAGSSIFKKVLAETEAKELLDKLGDEVNEEYIHDFRNWIAGIGKSSDYIKGGIPLSSVGHAKPLSRDPTVINFIDKLTGRVIDYYAEIANMKMRGPGVGRRGGPATLNDLWLYFKYVVRNDPINPEDFVNARAVPDPALIGNQDGIKDGSGPAPSVLDNSKSPYPDSAKEKRLREEAAVRDSQYKKNVKEKRMRSAAIGEGIAVGVAAAAAPSADPVPDADDAKDREAKAAIEEARKKREAELEGKVKESEEALKKEKARLAEIEERAKFLENERKNAEARAAAAHEASRKESLERRQKEEEARAERAAKDAAAARLSETDKDRALKEAARAAAEQKVVEAQAEIERKRQEGAALQAQINQAVKVVADLQARVNAGETEKMAKLEEAKRREMALQGEKEALAKEQAASTAKLGEAQKRAEEAEKKANEYFAEGVRVTAAMKAHQAEAVQLKTETEKLNAEIARIAEEKKALEAEVNARPSREYVDLAKRQYDQLLAEKQQKEAELEQLKRDADARFRAQEYEREQERQSHAVSLGGAQQSAEHKMGALTEQARATITQIATEKQAAEQRAAQLEQALLAHQQELEGYRQYIAVMNARIAAPAPAAAQPPPPPPIVEEMPAQPDVEMAAAPPAAAAPGTTLLDSGKYGKTGKLGSRLSKAIGKDLLAAARPDIQFPVQSSPHVLQDIVKLVHKNDPQKQAAILAASGVRRGGAQNVLKNILNAHPELDINGDDEDSAASRAASTYQLAWQHAYDVGQHALNNGVRIDPQWSERQIRDIVGLLQEQPSMGRMNENRLREVAQTAFHNAMKRHNPALPGAPPGAELEAKRRLKTALYKNIVRASLNPGIDKGSG